MAKKETAEAKLLKMIEASSPASDAKKNNGNKKGSFVAAIKSANKILLLGVIAAVLFLVNEVKVGMDMMNQNVEFSIERQSSQRGSRVSEIVPTIQRLSYYLAGVEQRNIFAPYEAKVVKAVEVTETNRRIAQRTASLKLVGIAWFESAETASAMIEDTEKGVTYFLMKGERIGDIKVETIYADSVALGYENEEIIISYDKSNM